MYGVGFLLNAMTDRGGDYDKVKACIGKQIKSVKISDDDMVLIKFLDKSILKLRDDAQSCCESRYFTTDDDLEYYSGTHLLGIETRDIESRETEYGDHEVQFLVITTGLGAFTIESHNEHNGYYGGISIEASVYNFPEDKDDSND